jgi:hypothetical protein
VVRFDEPAHVMDISFQILHSIAQADGLRWAEVDVTVRHH